MMEQVKQGRCDTCNYLMPLTESGDLIPHRRTYMREKGPFKGTLTTETCYGKPTATPAPSEDVPRVPCWCNGIGKTHKGPEDSDPHQRNCFYKREGYRAALATMQGEVDELQRQKDALEGALRQIANDSMPFPDWKTLLARIAATANEGVK